MRLSSAGEFATIGMIKGIAGNDTRGIITGIGDDAAVLSTSIGHRLLATTDMLVEGTHFDLSTTDFTGLGWKSLAASLSDIAAMGGVPRWYLVSLACGRDIEVEKILDFYKGACSLGAAHGVSLAGGDTTGSPGPLVVSVTVLGECPAGRELLRSGARPGDDVYVTGTLGDSAAGFDSLKNVCCRDVDMEYLVQRHLRPTPRVTAGAALGASGLVTSMIDISDGLSSDLGHILDESGVGAEIRESDIPLSGPLLKVEGSEKAVLLALNGGEDYELLFTAGPDAAERLASLQSEAGTRFSRLGVITDGRGAFIEHHGEKRALRPGGFEHFR